MAELRLGDSDLEQTPTDSKARGFGQNKQPGYFAGLSVDKSNHNTVAKAHGHSSPGDEFFIKCRRTLTHPILYLRPRIGGSCKAADRGLRDVKNRLRVFAARGSEGKVVVEYHESRTPDRLLCAS